MVDGGVLTYRGVLILDNRDCAYDDDAGSLVYYHVYTNNTQVKIKLQF